VLWLETTTYMYSNSFSIRLSNIGNDIISVEDNTEAAKSEGTYGETGLRE